jgi:hypothetical protein
MGASILTSNTNTDIIINKTIIPMITIPMVPKAKIMPYYTGPISI